MLSLLLNIVLLVIGGALITYGADWLTDGSASIARKYHISEMVIGLTLVAFGTSMPEFVVSMFAAFEGKAALSIGNIVGSNLFNTFMVVGCAAIVTPIVVKKSTLYKDIPFVFIASVVLCALALDSLLGGSEFDCLDRGDGIVLLCFMAIFLSYSFSIAKDGALLEEDKKMEVSLLKSSLLVVGGLVSLVGGGELFVRSACEVAREMGVSEAVIGLTLVAGGTSLPELVTSIVAAKKGYSGIAIGNVVGSNLFNIFFILGICATITPLPLQGITSVDLGLLLLSSALLLSMAWRKNNITRLEGLLLILIYVGYIGWLITNL